MKKNTILLIVSALMTLSFTAQASQSIKLQSDEGKVEFTAKGPLVRVNGKGPGADGELSVENEMASGVISLNLKELDTGISLRDDHMKNKYLEVSKPGNGKAILTLKNVKLPKNLKGKAKFTGMLSLHGVEKPVSGTVKMKGVKKGKAKISADFSVRFSDFNIELPSFKLVSVGEEIKISVSSKAVVSETKSI